MKEPRERRTIRVHPQERLCWRAAVELGDEGKSISRFVAESAVAEAKKSLETGEVPPKTWYEENLPLKENRFFSLFLTASEESLILRATKKAEIGFSDFVRRAASNHSPYSISVTS